MATLPLEKPSRDAVWLTAGEFVPRFASTVGRAHVAFHPLAVKRAYIEEKAFFNKRLVQVRRKLLDEAKEVLVFQLVLFGATTVLFLFGGDRGSPVLIMIDGIIALVWTCLVWTFSFFFGLFFSLFGSGSSSEAMSSSP